MALTRRGVFLEPTVGEAVSDTRRRTRITEQQVQRPPETPTFCITAIGTGNNAGAKDGAQSTLWTPYRGAVLLDLVVITLRSSFVEPCNVYPQRNFGDIDGFTLLAGETVARVQYNGEKWSPSDTFSVRMHNEQGFPDVGLSIQFWFRGYGGGAIFFTYFGGE